MFGKIALAFVLSACATLAAAQTYPSRPVRVIVPAPPGGLIDAVARTLSQHLTERFGQPFVVENRAGAGGSIGAQFVAQSPADGHTLLVHASQLLITPMVMKGATYDVEKDFTPVSRVGSVPLVIAVHPSVPANNLQDFFSLIKASPGKYSFGNSGIGSIGHLTVEKLKSEEKLDVVAVSYRGIAPAVVDLLGGQVSAMLDPVPILGEHIRNGRIKALAVTSPQRVPLLADVPTLAESGLKSFEAGSWYGVWGPAGMPADVTSKLAGEIAAAMATPQVAERLTSHGLVPIGSTPRELAAFQRSEIADYGQVVRRAGIEAQ